MKTYKIGCYKIDEEDFQKPGRLLAVTRSSVSASAAVVQTHCSGVRNLSGLDHEQAAHHHGVHGNEPVPADKVAAARAQV